jgi:integrase
VLRVIEPIWQTKTATASRLRGRIESVLDWAKARGYRSGDNPASWDVIGKVLPNHKTFAKVTHHRALPYQDVPAFVAKLWEHKAVAAQALLFTILTAARTQETVGARWSEISLKERVWTVPPGRMKGGVEHKVMLAPEVIDLLHQLPRDGGGDGFLFIGTRSGTGLNPKSLHRALARLKVDAVPHGFRSSFSDWAHECTAHSNHTIEISLAHKVGTEVEQAYRRGPMAAKRQRLMSDWSRFCCTPPKAISDNVVTLGAR